MVECDVANSQPCLLYLNQARDHGMIDETKYEGLLPGPIRKNAEFLVDPAFIDQLMGEEIQGMQIGNVARSRMFTTDLYPQPINNTAFNVSRGAAWRR
jgi:hypothetical protein